VSYRKEFELHHWGKKGPQDDPALDDKLYFLYFIVTNCLQTFHLNAKAIFCQLRSLDTVSTNSPSTEPHYLSTLYHLTLSLFNIFTQY